MSSCQSILLYLQHLLLRDQRIQHGPMRIVPRARNCTQCRDGGVIRLKYHLVESLGDVVYRKVLDDTKWQIKLFNELKK